MEGYIEFLGYFKKYEEGALTIDDTLIDTSGCRGSFIIGDYYAYRIFP